MRIGLVGAGFIGRVHLKAAESVPGLDVVGIVDPVARQDHPDLAGIPFFDSLQALARSEQVDGVVVAVPDQFHVPVAIEALNLGLAVMLEKPAATSLVEAVSLAQTPGAETRVLVAHQRRHHPAAQVAKDLIDRNGLGRLLGVSGVFALRKDDNYFVERPRGVGLVNLIHDLDLLQHFCGRIDVISAVASHAGRGAREEDTLALTMEFDSGVIGTMLATDSSPSPFGWDQGTTELPSIPYTPSGVTYSLLGREASLTIPDLRLYRHHPGDAWHQPLVESRLETPDGNAYVNQLNHFVQVTQGTAPPIVGIREAIATQAALEAVFLSAQENRRVRTDDLVESSYEKAA